MRIIIIGAGFAGLTAAQKLGKTYAKRSDIEITLLDRHSYCSMLPSLPDLAGEQLQKPLLIGNIASLLPKKVNFIQETIQKIELVSKTVHTNLATLNYDYLIVASGSTTNFYGFNDHRESLFTLENIDDALRINAAFKAKIKQNKPFNAVISGAGFTGIELACNLYRLARAQKATVTITIVEKFNQILGGMSETIIRTIENETKKLGISILKSESIQTFDGSTVTLSSGKTIADAFVCWCSGVRMGLPLVGNHKEINDGRVVVDNFLRVPEHNEVFIAGDAAAFKFRDGMLRRAVSYAASQGAQAAFNVIATIGKKQPKPFEPFDMGWVIPVNLTSVGYVMGIPVVGRIGLLVHYFICGVKNYSLKNFIGYALSAFKFTLLPKNYTPLKK